MSNLSKAVLFGLPVMVWGCFGCGSSDGNYRVTVSESGSALRDAQANTPPSPESEELSSGELERCGSLFDGDTEFVQVSGSQSTVELDGSDLLAVKISGNRNAVDVQIEALNTSTSSTGEEGFRGLCFILSGNQATATVDIQNFSLGTFAVIARGNQPHVLLDVGDPASVDAFEIDISGNQGRLTVTGDGNVTCPTGNLRGNGTEIICDGDT